MNSVSLSKLAIPAAAIAMLLTACGGKKVVVNTPPPTVVAAAAPAPSPVVVATVPPQPAPPSTAAVLGPSPGSGYVRVDGYYTWAGDHYEWVPPTWARVPRAGATFVPGHWESTPGGYMWRPAYWQ